MDIKGDTTMADKKKKQSKPDIIEIDAKTVFELTMIDKDAAVKKAQLETAQAKLETSQAEWKTTLRLYKRLFGKEGAEYSLSPDATKLIEVIPPEAPEIPKK